MPRGSWSRQGTGTLTASAILLIVVILVAGVHLASSARRDTLALERKVVRQMLLFSARAAADEARFAFFTIINQELYNPPKGDQARLQQLLSRNNNGQFLGKELYGSPPKEPVEPSWASVFRKNPQGFSCTYEPLWAKRYFGPKKGKKSFFSQLDKVKIECVQFRKAGPTLVEGKLKFSARATKKVTSNTLVIRPYELIVPFRLNCQLTCQLEYLAPIERRVDIGLKRGDRQ